MLIVDDVHRSFGPVVAVESVSFSIPTGSTFGLLGPNGAGKTTTMRMILGILPVESGTITWNGKKIDERARKRFGYLPEERGLYGKLKVRDHIAYFARLHGMTEPELEPRIDQWIERLDLGKYADRPCSQLSKGNQQKVQLACAAVHEPEFLVLDEPFSGLDPVNAEIMISVFSELRARGATIVLSSHQMWQLEHLCDAFCIVSGGRNRANGTLADLRAAWPTRIVRVSPSSDAASAYLTGVSGATRLATSNGTLEYEVPAAFDFAAMLRGLVEAAPVTHFERVDPSLHEIYLHTIGANP